MPKAPPFPDPWGWDQLIGSNKTNIVNASIQAWNNAGKPINETTGLPLDPAATGMGSAIAFGMLPIVLAAMVYIRTEKITPSLFVMLLSTGGLQMFSLLDQRFLNILWIITGISIGLALAYAYWNKD